MARSLPFLTFGQSYAELGYGRNASHYCFDTAIHRAILSDSAAITSRVGSLVESGDMTQLRQRAQGGSAILQANDNGNGYWVSDTNTAGPLLTATVDAISGYAIKPKLAVWSHGEADAQSSALNVANVSSAVTATMFPSIRNACKPSSPNDLFIFVDMLGFRYAADQERENALRDMMLNIVSSGVNVFRGSEKYAVELDSTFHPTQTGYQQLGAHTGRKAAHFLSTGNQLAGPRISSAVRSGNSVSVNINVPVGGTLVKPEHPAHFCLYDAGGVRMPYSASWSGNTLNLRCPSQPASLRYPAREERFDVGRIVRLSNPSDPIYSGEIGLPLESSLPITL